MTISETSLEIEEGATADTYDGGSWTPEPSRNVTVTIRGIQRTDRAAEPGRSLTFTPTELERSRRPLP